MAFTKVVGAGIHTLSNITSHNINSSGIITATKFVGPFDGTSGTFSGNVTIGGNLSVAQTVTYEDVKNVDSVGIGTFRQGVFIPDTKELKIGNTASSPDLKLYHDNNGDSYISNATGHLTIRNNTSGKIINLQPKSGANGIIARYEGAAELYHNGTEKFKTTTSGAEVTNGNLTISNTAPVLYLTDTDANSDYSLVVNGGSFRLRDETNGENRLTLNSSGVLHAMTPTVVLGESTFGSSSITKVYSGLGSTKKNALMVLNPSASVAGRGAGVAVGAMGAGDDYIGTLYAQRDSNGDNRGTTTLEGKDAIVIKTNASGTTKTALTFGTDGELAIPAGSNIASRLTFGGNINIYHDGNMKFENGTGYLKLSSANNLYIDGAALYFRNAGGTEFARFTSDGTLKFTGQNTSLETAGITHHTNNNLYIRGGTSGLVLGNHDNTNTIHISNSDYIKFETTDGSEKLRITGSGSVGVNTTSPENADSMQIFGTTTPLLTIKAGATGSDANRRASLRLWTNGNKIYKLEADASDGGLKIYDSTTPRFVIDSDGHALFSGLTTKNDPRNAAGITIKSASGGGGVSFQNFGANGSRNWRIRPDDMTGWGALEFSVSPTTNSATDWPDHADDVVLSLEGNKNVIVRNGKLGVKEVSPFAELDIASSVEDSDSGSLANHGIRLSHVGAADEEVIPISATFVTQQARARAGIGFISKTISGSAGMGGAIGFYTRNTADGHSLYRTDERVRIHENGRVTIGDSDATPAGTYGLLHLYQASNDPYMIIQNGGAGDSGVDLGGIAFRNNTNQQTMIKTYQANINTANLHFYTNYAGSFADRFLMESTGTFIIQGNVADEKLVLAGSSQPYIRWREGTTNKAYMRWNSAGYLGLYNQEDGSVLRLKDSIDFSKDGSTFHGVHHSDNYGHWGENYTAYFVGTNTSTQSVIDEQKVRFYKVSIDGTSLYGGVNYVDIVRAGVHDNNGTHGHMWVGSMDVRIKCRFSNCGNGSSYSRVVHNYHSNTSALTQGQGGGNIARVANYLACTESSRLYVWLRGQLTYYIRVNGRPANIYAIDMNDYRTTMDSSVHPAGFDGEGRDAYSIYYGYQGETGAGRKLYGTSGGIEAQGNVSATGSKPFKIPHPLVGLSTTKNLVHAAIEGPQCDNIYRGKTTLVAGISTVNIDTNAGMTDGTFATLNRDVQCFTTNETGWTPIKGSVSGNQLTILAQDNSCTDTISWMVVGERQDDNIINNTMTDSQGHLIVEPDFEEIVEPENPGEFASGSSQIGEDGSDQTFTQPLST